MNSAEVLEQALGQENDLNENDWYFAKENKSDNGSDQPTKSDGIQGNESTNGSDESTLFFLYVLIIILVHTREELYTTIISYRIPIVEPNQIRWKIVH